MRTIYLDYCTTTPIAASVRESMLPFLSEFYGHPTSSHWFGRATQEAMEDARSSIATLLDCHPSEVVFTSGATESVNMALLGVARAIGKKQRGQSPHIVTTELEHSCVRRTVQQLVSEGWEATTIGSDENGVLDIDQFESSLRATTRLATINHASHRIGTIQPLDTFAELCHEHDVLLHADSAQSVGKIETRVEQLGVDLLSFSGHKMYAPKGIGALYIRTGVPMEPIMFGDGGEAGLRPGTSNVPHIVGFGQAAKLANAGLESSQTLTQQYRDRFLQQLEHMLGRPIRVHGAKAERLPGLLSFELPGVNSIDLQQHLPEICFSPGAIGCNGNGATTSLTHAAIGLNDQESASTIRVSFGWTTSEEELQQAIHMIATAYESLL